MTRQTTVKWLDLVKEWRILNPDKAVVQPAKFRSNDNRKLRTHRHNKAVLFRRG